MVLLQTARFPSQQRKQGTLLEGGAPEAEQKINRLINGEIYAHPATKCHEENPVKGLVRIWWWWMAVEGRRPSWAIWSVKVGGKLNRKPVFTFVKWVFELEGCAAKAASNLSLARKQGINCVELKSIVEIRVKMRHRHLNSNKTRKI